MDGEGRGGTDIFVVQVHTQSSHAFSSFVPCVILFYEGWARRFHYTQQTGGGGCKGGGEQERGRTGSSIQQQVPNGWLT